MRTASQVVFIEGPGGGFILRGENVVEEVTHKRLIGLGGDLPAGMSAGYLVRREEDGRETVSGVMQARARGGRRYFTDTSETAAQRRLLRWSARILRERSLEGVMFLRRAREGA